MSRRRYFKEQRSGNGAIYHCVKTEVDPGDRIRLFNLMNKIKSDTISQDKINSVLNQLREGTAFNIHTHSSVSFSFSSTSAGHEPMTIWIRFDPYPASEQQGIIYKFQINDQRYVFMFSNRYEGINVKIVEESYTSKCSFLDNERICKHESYKGRRTKRGLFKTSSGKTINADINGAFNIIRKSEKESFDVTMLPEGRGFWWNPVRISV